MKNFLFDLYGTLVDIRTDEESDGFWSEIAFMLKTGDAQGVRARYLALCRERALPAGGEFDLLGVFRALLREYSSESDLAAFARAFRAASTRRLRLFDGAEKLLDGLRSRGAKTYLLSNAQACFTCYELERLGLVRRFDGIVLSSEVGRKKPSADFFRAAFARFSLAPQDCVYVGNDLFDDVAGARGVGMRSVYIQTEQSGKYSEKIPVDIFAASRGELEKILYAMAEEEG